jgi:hypothetical protein
VTVSDGAVGAAVLALREAGAAVDERVFDTLVDSVGSLAGRTGH